MKYLCLIYDNEQQWAEMHKEVQDKYMGEYTAFGEASGMAGKVRGANQLQPAANRHRVRSRNRQGLDDRCPFVETKGNNWRLLPDRGGGSERCDSGSVAYSRLPGRARSRSGRSWSATGRSGRTP